MKLRFFAVLAFALSLCLLATAPLAQAQTNYPGFQAVVTPNYSFPAQSFTATGQTGTKINLAGFSSGTVTVTGTALTTATWAIQGSADGGTTWFPLLTATIAVPGTTATSQTTTASSMYIVNLACMTNVRFVTSGTFTATALSIKLTASANKGLL